MSNLDALSFYAVFLGLAAAFVLIWVTRQQKTKQDATIWMISGVVGVLLGLSGSMGAVHLTGYQLSAPVAASTNDGATPPMMPGMTGGASGGMSSPGGAMPTPGMGGPGGGMGGMMGMGGGGRGPSPKRQLTTLVRKLELLTGDITLVLSDEQRVELIKRLSEFAELKTLTDEEAEQKHKELLDLLSDDQKAKQEAIGLPFRMGGGGGGGFGGGSPPDPEANPFADETNSKALQSLLDRLKGLKSN